MLRIRSDARLEQGANDEDDEDDLENRPSWVVLVRGLDIPRYDGRPWYFVERRLQRRPRIRQQTEQRLERRRRAHRACIT